jgi:hypothetical protein
MPKPKPKTLWIVVQVWHGLIQPDSRGEPQCSPKVGARFALP